MNEQLLEPQSETRMEETAPDKPRLKLRNPLKGLRGKKKRWLLLLVVIAVAGGAVTVRLLSKPQTASAVTSYQEEDRIAAGYRQFPQLQRHAAAGRLLHGFHSGVRRNPQRYL